MIKAHIIDSRGVYLRTYQVDPAGPQPAGAIYADLPVVVEGHTRMWLANAWQQVEDSSVPAILEPAEYRPTPQEVTMAQCRLALFDLRGIETDEEFFSLVDVLPESDRPRALLELRTRPTVQIDNPLVVAVCEANDWDRDALFIYAAGL